MHAKIPGSDLAIGNKSIAKCGQIIRNSKATLNEDEVTCPGCINQLRSEKR